jgi:hypothetical protein
VAKTPEERSFPIHQKSVLQWHAQEVRNLIALYPDLLHAWNEINSLMTEVQFANVNPQQLIEAQWEQDDMDSFIRTGLVEETPDHSPTCGAVAVFTVVEFEKARRRAIFWPRYFNSLISDLTKTHCATIKDLWPTTEELLNDAYKTCAAVTDCTSFFHQIPLDSSLQHTFRFTFKGRAYRLTTIPTGISCAPALAQIALTALKRHVEERYPVKGRVFIDNIRFAADTSKDSSDSFSFFRATCTRLNITLNKDETHVATQEYTFLGVDYNHREKSVKLSERFRKKMTSADAWENLCMSDCETLFSRCVYASTILKIAGCDFYHIYKFMRRRISAMTLPNSAANVWESIRSSWSEWITKCSTETRHLKPPSPLETQINAPRLYTDASNAGWGAMFFISAREVSYCGGSWSQYWLDTSINVREAEAAYLGIQQLVSQEQPWHLNVDNTSVVYALSKARSRAHRLNAVVRRILHTPQHSNLLSIQYVNTNDNPADALSRLGHRTPTTFSTPPS